MNRTELVEAVVAATGLEKRQAEVAVRAVADVVIAETRSGEKVSVFGFGTFTPTSRAARMGRNPRTNTPVKVPASKGVRFTPAASFKTNLNSKRGAAKKAAPAKRLVAKAASKAATSRAPAVRAPSRAVAKAAKAAPSKAVSKAAPSKAVSKAAVSKAPASKAAVSRAPASKAPASKAAASRVSPSRSTAKTASRVVRKAGTSDTSRVVPARVSVRPSVAKGPAARPVVARALPVKGVSKAARAKKR